MVCSECKSCKKFLTNDCPGSAEFTKDGCNQTLRKKNKETDVCGCC